MITVNTIKLYYHYQYYKWYYHYQYYKMVLSLSVISVGITTISTIKWYYHYQYYQMVLSLSVLSYVMNTISTIKMITIGKKSVVVSHGPAQLLWQLGRLLCFPHRKA